MEDMCCERLRDEACVFITADAECVCVLLLQDLLQSCARGGRRRVEDMCYERRRAEACVDESAHHALPVCVYYCCSTYYKAIRVCVYYCRTIKAVCGCVYTAYSNGLHEFVRPVIQSALNAGRGHHEHQPGLVLGCGVCVWPGLACRYCSPQTPPVHAEASDADLHTFPSRSLLTPSRSRALSLCILASAPFLRSVLCRRPRYWRCVLSLSLVRFNRRVQVQGWKWTPRHGTSLASKYAARRLHPPVFTPRWDEERTRTVSLALLCFVCGSRSTWPSYRTCVCVCGWVYACVKCPCAWCVCTG